MFNFYLYESTTGRVLATAIYNNEGDGAAAGTRIIAVGEIKPSTEYAPGGVKTQRPVVAMAINKSTVVANGVDSVTITLIPVGAKVSIFKDQDALARAIVTVNDGTLIATFDTPGLYTLFITLFPNVDVLFTVTATS